MTVKHKSICHGLCQYNESHDASGFIGYNSSTRDSYVDDHNYNVSKYIRKHAFAKKSQNIGYVLKTGTTWSIKSTG